MTKKFTKLSIAMTFCLNATFTIAQLPTFQWAKEIGGASGDWSKDVAVDPSGNVFYAGGFDGSVDFDPGAGTFSLTSISTGGGYVSKLDGSGNFIWAVAIPGPANALATDASGNVYVTGQYTLTQDFDPGAGTTNLTASSANYTDLYVTKYDAAGNFVWAQSIGGTDIEIPQSLDTDASGDLLITGSYKNTVDFDPSAATFSLFSMGAADGFLLKLNSAGGFVFADRFGSSFSGESAFDATTDASGNIYVTGTFAGTPDFDPGPGTTTLTSSGSRNVFILKLTSANAFVWVRGFGSIGDDEGRCVTTDASGVYVGGLFAGTTDFDPSAGTTTLTAVGNYDAFIEKLDATGNFGFARNVGSTGYDFCKSIQVSSSGKIVYSGSFSSTCDFDPGAGTYSLTSSGATDCFVSILDASGNFLAAGKFGGFSSDYAEGMVLNNAGDIFMSGSFLFTVDFDPSPATYTLSGIGSIDAFVMRLGDVGAGIMENSSLFGKAKVFPNPCTDQVTIETGVKTTDKIVVSFYDLLGKEIKVEEISPLSSTITLDGFKGIYIYRITRNNEPVATGKLICE